MHTRNHNFLSILYKKKCSKNFYRIYFDVKYQLCRRSIPLGNILLGIYLDGGYCSNFVKRLKIYLLRVSWEIKLLKWKSCIEQTFFFWKLLIRCAFFHTRRKLLPLIQSPRVFLSLPAHSSGPLLPLYPFSLYSYFSVRRLPLRSYVFRVDIQDVWSLRICMWGWSFVSNNILHCRRLHPPCICKLVGQKAAYFWGVRDCVSFNLRLDAARSGSGNLSFIEQP